MKTLLASRTALWAFGAIALAASVLFTVYAYVVLFVPVVPTADMFDGRSGGCSEFLAFRLSKNERFAIGAGWPQREHPLQDGTHVVKVGRIADVRSPSAILHVEVRHFKWWGEPNLCNDVRQPLPLAKWTAVSGTATITKRTTAQSNGSQLYYLYQVAVVLENVVLDRDDTGERAVLDFVEIRPEEFVGLYP